MLSANTILNFAFFWIIHWVTGNLLYEDCHVNNFKKILLSQDDADFVLYGLTQDCQLFFARADQLHLLSQLRVQTRVTYCLPELIQFHWQELHTIESIGLELIFKRANHQICALPLEFPSRNALAGNVLFSYSISSAMNYARCSYITNSSFVMEPDLSFMDSTFGDVIYFVDPQSTGSYWTVRQFRLDRDGLRHSLEMFIVKNYVKSHKHQLHPHKAAEYLLGLDVQRRKLYAIHRHTKQISFVCEYDLLFRPHKANIKDIVIGESGHGGHKYRINSFSIDGNFSIFSDFHQENHDRFNTRIRIADLSQNSTSACLIQLPFLVKTGFIRQKSLDNLKKNKLPQFTRHHNVLQKQTEYERSKNQSVVSHHRTHSLPINVTHDHTLTTPKTAITTPKLISFERPQTPVEQSTKSAKPVGRKEEEILESDESNELGFLTEITTKINEKDKFETDLASSGELPSAENEQLLKAFDQQNITTDSLNGLSSSQYITSSCNFIIIFMVFIFNFI